MANAEDRSKKLDWLVDHELDRTIAEMRKMARVYAEHGFQEKADEILRLIAEINDSRSAA